MKVSLGDTVRSEFGSGRVVAMSKEWCIHRDEAGNEYAVMWDDIRAVVTPKLIDSEVTAIEHKSLPEETDEENSSEQDGQETV